MSPERNLDDGAEPAGKSLTLAPGRHRAGVLHGRRQGRRLRESPTAALDTFLPRCALPPSGPLHPAALFPEPIEALRLEVGFGGGEHLHAQAGAHPGTGFIGCEPFRNGVASLMGHMAAAWRQNLRVHAGDAGEVIDRLPDGALTRVDLLYPDPWPKRRQRKRRFVSNDRLDRLARVMAPGATFRFATDIDDYAGWTLAHAGRHPAFTWDARTARDWREPWPDWVPTRYEAKARREGRDPVYLTFRRR